MLSDQVIKNLDESFSKGTCTSNKNVNKSFYSSLFRPVNIFFQYICCHNNLLHLQSDPQIIHFVFTQVHCSFPTFIEFFHASSKFQFKPCVATCENNSAIIILAGPDDPARISQLIKCTINRLYVFALSRISLLLFPIY